MFTVAAVWNCAAALLFIVLAVLDQSILNWFLKIVPSDFLWYYLFFSLVAVFGLGYFWISRDVYVNRNIIKMGIIGKLLAFFIVGKGWVNGVVTILTASAGVADLLFAGLFIHALIITGNENELVIVRQCELKRNRLSMMLS